MTQRDIVPHYAFTLINLISLMKQVNKLKLKTIKEVAARPQRGRTISKHRRPPGGRRKRDTRGQSGGRTVLKTRGPPGGRGTSGKRRSNMLHPSSRRFTTRARVKASGGE